MFSYMRLSGADRQANHVQDPHFAENVIWFIRGINLQLTTASPSEYEFFEHAASVKY